MVGASQPRHWSGWDVVDRVCHSSSWPGITGASPECCNKSKLTEKAKTRADRGLDVRPWGRESSQPDWGEKLEEASPERVS